MNPKRTNGVTIRVARNGGVASASFTVNCELWRYIRCPLPYFTIYTFLALGSKVSGLRITTYQLPFHAAVTAVFTLVLDGNTNSDVSEYVLVPTHSSSLET